MARHKPNVLYLIYNVFCQIPKLIILIILDDQKRSNCVSSYFRYLDNSDFFAILSTLILGYYFSGDGAHRTEDGYYQITGRMDDVINVSGHRIGTAEVEDAMVGTSLIESAIIGTSLMESVAYGNPT